MFINFLFSLLYHKKHFVALLAYFEVEYLLITVKYSYRNKLKHV
jgi:hypothetical protein